MDKRQRDIDDNSGGYYESSTARHLREKHEQQFINHVAKEAREQELERVEELQKEIQYGLWCLAHEDNSHETLMTVTEKLKELTVIAQSAIKANK